MNQERSTEIEGFHNGALNGYFGSLNQNQIWQGPDWSDLTRQYDDARDDNTKQHAISQIKVKLERILKFGVELQKRIIGLMKKQFDDDFDEYLNNPLRAKQLDTVLLEHAGMENYEKEITSAVKWWKEIAKNYKENKYILALLSFSSKLDSDHSFGNSFSKLSRVAEGDAMQFFEVYGLGVAEMNNYLKKAIQTDAVDAFVDKINDRWGMSGFFAIGTIVYICAYYSIVKILPDKLGIKRKSRMLEIAHDFFAESLPLSEKNATDEEDDTQSKLNRMLRAMFFPFRATELFSLKIDDIVSIITNLGVGYVQKLSDKFENTPAETVADFACEHVLKWGIISGMGMLRMGVHVVVTTAFGLLFVLYSYIRGPWHAMKSFVDLIITMESDDEREAWRKYDKFPKPSKEQEHLDELLQWYAKWTATSDASDELIKNQTTFFESKDNKSWPFREKDFLSSCTSAPPRLLVLFFLRWLPWVSWTFLIVASVSAIFNVPLMTMTMLSNVFDFSVPEEGIDEMREKFRKLIMQGILVTGVCLTGSYGKMLQISNDESTSDDIEEVMGDYKKNGPAFYTEAKYKDPRTPFFWFIFLMVCCALGTFVAPVIMMRDLSGLTGLIDLLKALMRWLMGKLDIDMEGGYMHMISQFLKKHMITIVTLLFIGSHTTLSFLPNFTPSAE